MRGFSWFVVMFVAALFAVAGNPAEAAGGRLFSRSTCATGRCGVLSTARTVVRGSAAAVGLAVRGTGRVVGRTTAAARTVVRGAATTARSFICGSTSTAQGVAEIQAAAGSRGHHGGNSTYEGVGSGPTPQAALANCCTNGSAVIDEGVALGVDGRYYACRRYAN